MDYQTFRGADVQEALFNVRQALGTDALIESTRHVQGNNGGAVGRSFVEIIAAPSLDRNSGPRANSTATAARTRASGADRALTRMLPARSTQRQPASVRPLD